jgi:Zn-dependent protease/CBS domain-containing protein
MAGSLQIARIAGIPIRLHWSFVLTLAIFSFRPESSVLESAVYVCLLFGCILLHELGHSLMARQFGISTTSIVLMFVGGVAILRGKTKPMQELWIALAGPFVSLLISIGLLIYMQVSPTEYDLFFEKSRGSIRWDNMLVYLFWGNLLLFLFNLIPAFPLDGGRALRAILSMATDEKIGTRISVGVGQVLAVVLFLVGAATQEYTLMFVAFLVFLGASSELNRVVSRSALDGRLAREAMMTSLFTMRTGDTLSTARNLLFQSSQTEFPVYAGSEVVGMLGQREITAAIKANGQERYVSEFMRPVVRAVSAIAPLNDCAELLANDPTPLIVLEDGALIGVIDRPALDKFITLTEAAGITPEA